MLPVLFCEVKQMAFEKLTDENENIINPDASFRSAAVITPSDSTDLTKQTRGIWVGGTGAIAVNMVDTGSTVVFAAVPAGTLLPVRAKRVLAIGTTATNLVALW
jgi:hypothetical protein